VKNTNGLTVRETFSQTEDRAIIHPNDGYDPDLMSIDDRSHLFCGSAFVDFTAARGSSATGRLLVSNV